jgi:ribosomal protein S18 acetylase RimI-like enzyme
MRRHLGNGFELDDDPARIDRSAIHRFLGLESYWASGRSRERQDAVVEGSQRVVGLYREGEQVGFARVVSDGHVHAYLADVYVLPEHRGAGFGVELVRFAVEDGPFADCRWLLHTSDAHSLYRRFGFVEIGERVMERPPGRPI